MLRRRGANAIEFALCMPVFVLIAAGTVDFAWLFYHRSTVDAALGEGCREGSLVDPMLGNPESAAETALVDALEANGLECASVACVASASIVGSMPDTSVHCELDITFDPLFGILAGDQHMHAETQRRLEWQRETAIVTPPEG